MEEVVCVNCEEEELVCVNCEEEVVCVDCEEVEERRLRRGGGEGFLNEERERKAESGSSMTAFKYTCGFGWGSAMSMHLSWLFRIGVGDTEIRHSDF
jgi:hypothetical protein